MKKIIYAIAAASLVSFASCSDWLDINTDPNVPAANDVSTSMILPGAEMNVISTYGNFLRITGGYYAQIYAHQFGTSNYVDYSQFSMSATRCSSTYAQLYQRGIQNLNTVMEKSKAASDWGTYLAAATLRAFAFEALVDCFGETPYTESCDPSNLAPKYDEGEDVYRGVIAELDFALQNATESSTVATNFLYKGENAANWIKFANTLKFKMYMRMGDMAGAKSCIENGNFIASDVELAGCWSEAAGQESPFYAEEFSTLGGSTQINVVANLAIIGTMMQYDDEGNLTYQDPRLVKIFTPNANGKFTGNLSGTNMSTASAPYNATSYWCRPVASYDMPVSLISMAELNFFLSEYYAKGSDATKAAQYYEDAVKASCTGYGLEEADADAILAQFPFVMAEYKKSIGIQKWLSLSGVNPFEAWCEVRRLDYPAFSSLLGSSMYSGSGTPDFSKYVPGTLYTPYQVYEQVGNGKLLERWPYAESSSSRNPSAPAFKGYTTPIFWGK